MQSFSEILCGETRGQVAKARLDSWKSIAEYLKRSPRTVQRWHAEFGLPVHHFGGGKGPVFSYSDELDAWLTGFVEASGGESAGPEELSAAKKTRSSELVAQADELWELRSEDNLPAIAALYRNAIDQNPACGPAFIGVANVIILSALVGIMRGSAAFPRAIEAVQRALRLGFEGPETSCASAWLKVIHERKWKRAREEFDEALDAQPRSSHALTGRALLLVAERNLEAATQCLQDAWRQNTFALPSNALLCWVQYLAGDYEQAMETVAQARMSGETGSLIASMEALALIQSGSISSKLKRIEAIAGSYPRSLVLQGALGYACAVSDQTTRARELLHNLNRMKGDSLYPIALILMALDERNQVISCLEASYAEGSLWSLGFRSDPILQHLRDDPSFGSRLRKLGPPA